MKQINIYISEKMLAELKKGEILCGKEIDVTGSGEEIVFYLQKRAAQSGGVKDEETSHIPQG